MKKELLIISLLVFIIISISVSADIVIIPSGPHAADINLNLTACLITLNNTEGSACVFNYTSGTNSSTFTLPKSYFNITVSTTYASGAMSDFLAPIFINDTNNITIDFNNSILIGINGSAINIFNSSNITIKNCRVYNYPLYGIYINNSYNITIDNCILYNQSYRSLLIQYTNKSFFRNINISSNRFSVLNLGVTLYNSLFQVFLSNSHYNLFNNLTLLGYGFVGTINAGAARGIYLIDESNFNNFTNSTLDKFGGAALSVCTNCENNTFSYFNFTSNLIVLDDDGVGAITKSMLINKSYFIRNNYLYAQIYPGLAWNWGSGFLNITESKFIENAQDDQIIITINGTLNKTTGEFVNFNVSFLDTLNKTPVNPKNYNISIYPNPSDLKYHQATSQLFGNFSTSRPGIYSIRVNMTDTYNNVITKVRKFYVNTSVTNITYYYAANWTGQHGQASTIGSGSTDASAMLLSVPTVNGVSFCGYWTSASPDEIPPLIFGVISNIQYNLWHNTSGNINFGYRKYAFYPGGGSIVQDASTPTFESRNEAVWYNTTSISNRNVPINSQNDWFWLALTQNSGAPVSPHIFTGPTYPSNVNITYLYSKPIITNITNLDAILLSATLPHDSSQNATIYIEGDTSTNITIQMPDTTISYNAYYDGTLCAVNYNNCNITQVSGSITLTIALGSIHSIGIEGIIPGIPSGSSPSSPSPEPVPPEPIILPIIVPIIPIDIPISEDPIENIEVTNTEDQIIANILTESGIETKLSLILEDIGLLKKKPKVSIEFRLPEIQGNIKEFILFNWFALLNYLVVLIVVLFLISFRGYLKNT